MRGVRSAVLAILLLAVASPAAAAARTLAVCGEQSGHAYYIEGGVVTADDAGWQRDKIGGGRTTLSLAENGEADLIFTDSTGGVFSARAEGGSVLLLRQSMIDIAAIVAYPAVVEVYQFIQRPDGSAVMLHLQSKGHDLIRKGALMVGECSAVDLTAIP